MDRFVFLEDEATADVAFIATGKTKAEIIENACWALTNVITDGALVEPNIEYQKEFRAEDLLGLVYDVLNYIVFLFDTDDILFKTFSIALDEENFSLRLKAIGETYDESKHDIKTHVKAVTFFGMEFTETSLKVTLDL